MKKTTLGLLAGVVGSAFAFWVGQRFAHWRSGAAPLPDRDEYSRLAEGII